jgi:hypothetical protein
MSAISIGLGAVPSSAAGEYTFTPQNPSYTGNDPRGNFAAQIMYSTARLQWGLQLSPATAESATGLMDETADLYCDGRVVVHDSHPGVSPRYFIHASAPLGSGMTSCNWDLKVHETFPIAQGTRDIDIDFPFTVAPS